MLASFGIKSVSKKPGFCVICQDSFFDNDDSNAKVNTNSNGNPNSNTNSNGNSNSNTNIFQLNKCKHKMHCQCAEDLFNSQASDTFLVCPICKNVLGIKKGNFNLNVCNDKY